MCKFEIAVFITDSSNVFRFSRFICAIKPATHVDIVVGKCDIFEVGLSNTSVNRADSVILVYPVQRRPVGVQ